MKHLGMCCFRKITILGKSNFVLWLYNTSLNVKACVVLTLAVVLSDTSKVCRNYSYVFYIHLDRLLYEFWVQIVSPMFWSWHNTRLCSNGPATAHARRTGTVGACHVLPGISGHVCYRVPSLPLRNCVQRWPRTSNEPVREFLWGFRVPIRPAIGLFQFCFCSRITTTSTIY